MDIISFLLGYTSGKNGSSAEPILQEKTVTPGESVIEVTPDDGFDGLSKVIVEAIAGSGKTPVVVSGKFNPTSASEFTVQHSLGVVPDIAIFCLSETTTNHAIAIFCVSFSTAFNTAVGKNKGSATGVLSSGGNMSIEVGALDENASSSKSYCGFRNTTATEFTVGGSTFKLDTGKYYSYFLIGGLT